MSNDIELAVADSLKRQIIEVKRQIDQIKNRDKSKFLEIRRKTDQRKARLVLTTLKLKKQLQDCQNILEESQRQWSLDLSNSQDLISKYIESLQLEKSEKIRHLYRLLDCISLEGRLQDSNYDETIEYNNSSEDITIEQECSTDVVYLSSNLRAVIEGSTLDRLDPNELFKLKISYISQEILKFIKSFQREEYQVSTKSSNKSEKFLLEEKKEFGGNLHLKQFHQRGFSFSAPEVKAIYQMPGNPEGKEVSLSSEWEVESEVVQNDEANNKEESARWNSLSVISLHSASLSHSSEASESAELLITPAQKATQTEFKKKSIWRRVFCCCCKK